MTRIYNKRVLRLAPLWMWRYVDLLARDPSGYLVVLIPDWADRTTEHLRELSVDARTMYRTLDLNDALAARVELAGMIDAARLLARRS